MALLKLHIVPITIATEIDAKYVEAYFNRGKAKNNLQDYAGAISDFAKTIENAPKHADAYYNSGLAKMKIKQIDSGCMDFSKAGELGLAIAYEAILEYCQ
jgi:tetratricopeptide (TPR) repeat protein